MQDVLGMALLLGVAFFAQIVASLYGIAPCHGASDSFQRDCILGFAGDFRCVGRFRRICLRSSHSPIAVEMTLIRYR
jgi:hypothetical protein